MVKVCEADNRIFVQIPLLPIARYRSRAGEHPHYIDGLFDELKKVKPLHFSGKLLLVIYHYYRSTKSSRKIADFDNYDTKHLTDTLFSFYGGDHPLRCSILHVCEQGDVLVEGTYAILQEEPTQICLAEIRESLRTVFQKSGERDSKKQ